LKFFKDEESRKFWVTEVNLLKKNVTELIERMNEWDDDPKLKREIINNIESIFSSGSDGFLDGSGEKLFHFLNNYVLSIMFPLITRQSGEFKGQYFRRILEQILKMNESSLEQNLAYYEEFLGLDTVLDTKGTLLSRGDLELLEQFLKVYNNKERRAEKVQKIRERAVFGYNMKMTKRFQEIHTMVGFVSSEEEERDNLRGRTHITYKYELNPEIRPLLLPYGDLTPGLLLLVYMAYLSTNRNRLTQEARNCLLEFLAWSLIFGILEGNSTPGSTEPEISKNMKWKADDFVDVIYSLEKLLAYMIGRDSWLQSIYGSAQRDRRKRVPSKLVRVKAGKFFLRNNSIRTALSSIRIKPGLGGD